VITNSWAAGGMWGSLKNAELEALMVVDDSSAL